MGQIVSSAAKPKRCNLNKLSQLGTPAAGEHILVSSDNSMNAAGQGNFDCYIVGNGEDPATELEKKYIEPKAKEMLAFGNEFVTNGFLHDIVNGAEENYVEGHYYDAAGNIRESADWCIQLGYIPAVKGDNIEWNAGAAWISAALVLVDASLNFIATYSCNPQHKSATIGRENCAYICMSFAKAGISDVFLKVNGKEVWRPTSTSVGITPRIDAAASILGINIPTSSPKIPAVFTKGFIRYADGKITTSAINFFSQKYNVRGYGKVRFVGNHAASSSDVGAAFYDQNKNFISSIIYDTDASERTYKTYEVEIPANAYYFAFSIYVEFSNHAKEIELIPSFSINEKLSELVLLNAQKWLTGKQIYTNEGVGNVCRYVTYDSGNWNCLKIPCQFGEKIYFNGTLQGGLSPRLWCFTDENNVILSISSENEVVTDREVSVPENAAWLVVNDRIKNGTIHIYKNTPLTAAIAMMKNSEKDESLYGKRFSDCKSFGTQPAANGGSGSFCNITTGTYNDLLTTIYEPLRSQFPNYIKRTNIGKDASGTIDMYAYVFEPRYWQQSIYLQAGIHGIEVDAVACLARMMYLIATSDGSDKDLEYLRQCVKITVVPCVNVWGISQSPKQNNNYNNAGLQAWSSSTPPAEIANIKTYIEEASIIDELSFMLDMHTTTNDTYYDFYGNIQKYAKNVRTIYRTNAWLCEHYAKDGRTVDDQYLGYHEYADNHLFRQYYYYVKGIQTATLELSDYHWDTSLSTAPVITMGVTMWFNYVIQMVNDFYRSAGNGIPEGDYRESRG